MPTLTKRQYSVLEEIAYDFEYRRYRSGYIKRPPEGGTWEKASVAVKSLILARTPLLAVLKTEQNRVYLTSQGWRAFAPDVELGTEPRRLTQLADERVAFIRSMGDES